MPTTTLNADEHLTVSFSAASDTDEVHVIVDAERAVFAHVVDSRNLARFREGEDFDYYGPKAARREHDFEVALEHEGRWHLLIVNETDESVAVHYELYD